MSVCVSGTRIGGWSSVGEGGESRTGVSGVDVE